MVPCSLTTCLVTVVRRGKPELWRPTKLGKHVSVGTNATILPVTICDHVVIGAGAVVTKDITAPGIYAGNPARLLRRSLTPDLTLTSDLRLVMKIPFVDLHAQYLTIKQEIDRAIAEVIAESAYIRGRHVDAFEQAWAQNARRETLRLVRKRNRRNLHRLASA